MDASYKIQRGIHVHLIQFFMCPEFWVHIRMDHGYGLANIKIITEKYHGYVRSQYIEDSFETMIVIPILNRKRYF